MIPIADFSQKPLRQGQQPICIPCSYACAVSPLVKINDLTLANECIVFQNSIATHTGGLNGSLGLPASASGYDVIEAVNQQCDKPGFVEARKAVDIRRIGDDLQELETQLKRNRATAIIALSYPSAARRDPHSVCIGCDIVHGFFIRDSAQQTTAWNGVAADATGKSVVEALRNLDATAVRGEAMLLVEKGQPSSAPI